MPRPTWPTNRIMGVESWCAMCTPADALVAPGPRVTKQMPGWPVSLPCASAIMAAPPSWRHTVTSMLASCSASSTARKLSPGTQNSCCTPWVMSWSTRIWPPVREVVIEISPKQGSQVNFVQAASTRWQASCNRANDVAYEIRAHGTRSTRSAHFPRASCSAFLT